MIQDPTGGRLPISASKQDFLAAKTVTADGTAAEAARWLSDGPCDYIVGVGVVTSAQSLDLEMKRGAVRVRGHLWEP